ncbi:hypothetical protein [Vulcanococcus limneticus]|uniref:hypothetical protein n=1 Tax=Vulcanococcus limneticus TaxID=2170428 RepID=UPI00398BE2F0
MPPRPSPGSRSGLLLALAALALMGLAGAGGWWLGQRGSGGGDRSRLALERQADQLRSKLDQGSASDAEQERLVQLLLALDQQRQATQLLETLADRQPERWQLRLLLAELRRNGDDRAGAERELRQLLNLSPERIEALQLMTLLQVEQGRGQEAERQLRALLAKASKPTLQAQALPLGLLLGDLLQRQGQKGAAEALYLQQAQEFAKDPRPLLALALLKQEQGDTKAAQVALAKARERQPDKANPRLDEVAASWGLAGLRAPSAATKPQAAPASTGPQDP